MTCPSSPDYPWRRAERWPGGHACTDTADTDTGGPMEAALTSTGGGQRPVTKHQSTGSASLALSRPPGPGGG